MRPLPDGIEVRRAGRADVGPVVELVEAELESYRRWAPPHWSPPPLAPDRRLAMEGHFSGDEAWILLAHAGDELVGVVSLAPHTGVEADAPPPGTIYLWQMFVRADRQGSGLGAALLERAVAEARERGFERLTLWAAAGAAQARRFYEREGWALTGRTRDDFGFGLPLVEYGRATG
jgi:GNAT superfamily N-acetyltransferase